MIAAVFYNLQPYCSKPASDIQAGSQKTAAAAEEADVSFFTKKISGK
jgi:hypothetical protein